MFSLSQTQCGTTHTIRFRWPMSNCLWTLPSTRRRLRIQNVVRRLDFNRVSCGFRSDLAPRARRRTFTFDETPKRNPTENRRDRTDNERSATRSGTRVCTYSIRRARAFCRASVSCYGAWWCRILCAVLCVWRISRFSQELGCACIRPCLNACACICACARSEHSEDFQTLRASPRRPLV